MNIGAVIIGDEILSGKRQDKHFDFLKSLLAQYHLELSWVNIVGDDPFQLERCLRFTMQSDDFVLCFGGIGATPDDRTRQTVAKIAGVALHPHPQAIAEIEAQFGERAHPNRVLMGYLPVGADIVPNPINRIPGFQFNRHFFMPGFPEMAQPMSEWILKTHYPDIDKQTAWHETSIVIVNGRESELLVVMNQIVEQYPAVRLSSLPRFDQHQHPTIDFSLRGLQAEVEAAMQLVEAELTQQHLTWHQANK